MKDLIDKASTKIQLIARQLLWFRKYKILTWKSPVAGNLTRGLKRVQLYGGTNSESARIRISRALLKQLNTIVPTWNT